MNETCNFVILVNYNNYMDTLECVESIRKQTYNICKIIIVDNFSGNDSIKILREKCKDCIIIESKANIGFAGANNLAAEVAMEYGAHYITFLNNDTILEQNFFEILLNGLKKGECVCPQMLYYDCRDKINYAGGFFDYSKGSGTVPNRGEKYNPRDIERREVTLAQGCCIAMTVDTYKFLGPWKEEYFLYREDDEYTLRMLKYGIKIYYEPKAVLYHKENASSGDQAGSAFRNYYMLRNRLYNIKLYDLGKRVMIRTKIAALIKYFLYLLLNKKQYKYYLKALKDFECKREGMAILN